MEDAHVAAILTLTLYAMRNRGHRHLFEFILCLLRKTLMNELLVFVFGRGLISRLSLQLQMAVTNILLFGEVTLTGRTR